MADSFLLPQATARARGAQRLVQMGRLNREADVTTDEGYLLYLYTGDKCGFRSTYCSNRSM